MWRSSRSSTSTLSVSWITKLFTVSLRESPSTLQRNLISAACCYESILCPLKKQKNKTKTLMVLSKRSSLDQQIYGVCQQQCSVFSAKFLFPLAILCLTSVSPFRLFWEDQPDADHPHPPALWPWPTAKAAIMPALRGDSYLHHQRLHDRNPCYARQPYPRGGIPSLNLYS